MTAIAAPPPLLARKQLPGHRIARHVLGVAEHGGRDRDGATDPYGGRADLALDDDRAVQVQKIERFRIGLDLDLDDLALQVDLAIDVEDRFPRIEQRLVEYDGAMPEVEPAQRTEDRDAIVAGHVEDQRVEDLQAGQADHQGAHRSAAQRRL